MRKTSPSFCTFCSPNYCHHCHTTSLIPFPYHECRCMFRHFTGNASCELAAQGKCIGQCFLCLRHSRPLKDCDIRCYPYWFPPTGPVKLPSTTTILRAKRARSNGTTAPAHQDKCARVEDSCTTILQADPGGNSNTQSDKPDTPPTSYTPNPIALGLRNKVISLDKQARLAMTALEEAKTTLSICQDTIVKQADRLLSYAIRFGVPPNYIATSMSSQLTADEPRAFIPDPSTADELTIVEKTAPCANISSPAISPAVEAASTTNPPTAASTSHNLGIVTPTSEAVAAGYYQNRLFNPTCIVAPPAAAILPTAPTIATDTD